MKRSFGSEAAAEAYVNELMKDTPPVDSVVASHSNTTIAGVVAMVLGLPIAALAAFLGALLVGGMVVIMGAVLTNILMIVLQLLPFDVKSVLEVITGLVGLALGMALGGALAAFIIARLGHAGHNANPHVAAGIAVVAMLVVTIGVIVGNVEYNFQNSPFLKSWVGILLGIAACIPGFITAFNLTKESVEERVYCSECKGRISEIVDWRLSAVDTEEILKRISRNLPPYVPDPIVTVVPLSEDHAGNLELQRCDGCKTSYLSVFRWFNGTYKQTGETHGFQKKRLVACRRLTAEEAQAVLAVKVQKPVAKPKEGDG